ncbi:hypothetical protein DV532_16805 [Pseudomonas sp. Leaf58]|nr:hypothetical protein DV532_16805 [Pseudomonas sp. Leaf58]
MVACAGPIAGKPAPTGGRRSQSLCSACGSGHAREEAGTGDTNENAPNQSGRFRLPRQRLTCLPSA